MGQYDYDYDYEESESDIGGHILAEDGALILTEDGNGLVQET